MADFQFTVNILFFDSVIHRKMIYKILIINITFLLGSQVFGHK